MYKAITFAAIVTFLSLVFGCASLAPRSMDEVDINHIRKVSIITTIPEKDLVVLNHTESVNTNVGWRYGVFGSLFEAAFLTVVNDIKEQSALGGDPTPLREKLGHVPVEDWLANALFEKFRQRYEVVGPGRLCTNPEDMEKIERQPANVRINKYIPICEKLMVDAIIKVDFVYGIAVYDGKSPSAAIDARVAVYDLHKNKTVANMIIHSDKRHKSAHTIDEYTENEGALYLEELRKAVEAITDLISFEFLCTIPRSSDT